MLGERFRVLLSQGKAGLVELTLITRTPYGHQQVPITRNLFSMFLHDKHQPLPGVPTALGKVHEGLCSRRPNRKDICSWTREYACGPITQRGFQTDSQGRSLLCAS